MRNLQRKHLTRTAAVIAAAALGLGVHLALGFGLDQPVTTAVKPVTMAMVTVTPAQRACAAFATWEKHPAKSNLDALVVDSFSVPAKYLGADIGQLYADVEGGGTKYIASDKRYLTEDCTGL